MGGSEHPMNNLSTEKEDEELKRFVEESVHDVVQQVQQISLDVPHSNKDDQPLPTLPTASPVRYPVSGTKHTTAEANPTVQTRTRTGSQQGSRPGTGRVASSRPGTKQGSRQSSSSGEDRLHPGNCQSKHPVDPSIPLVPGASSCDALDVAGQPDASLRLHKAQIRALERDLEASQAARKSSSDDARAAAQKLKQLTSDHTALSKSFKQMENQVTKQQKQLEEQKTALAARDAALREIAAEANIKERTKQAVEGDLKSRNARLNRALEEVQRYRKLLEEVKDRERDVKSVAQSEHNRILNENRKLERQKAELLAAFRKQIKLIDVLKRQKVHIEAARMLQFTEDEFMRVLEMPATTR